MEDQRPLPKITIKKPTMKTTIIKYRASLSSKLLKYISRDVFKNILKPIYSLSDKSISEQEALKGE